MYVCMYMYIYTYVNVYVYVYEVLSIQIIKDATKNIHVVINILTN